MVQDESLQGSQCQCAITVSPCNFLGRSCSCFQLRGILVKGGQNQIMKPFLADQVAPSKWLVEKPRYHLVAYNHVWAHERGPSGTRPAVPRFQVSCLRLGSRALQLGASWSVLRCPKSPSPSSGMRALMHGEFYHINYCCQLGILTT